MERLDPVNFEQQHLLSLFKKRSAAIAVVAEIEAEIQRVQMGRKPQDLTPVLPPRDRFLLHQIDFNQTRAEQANEQSDAKAMKVVPYEHLIQ